MSRYEDLPPGWGMHLNPEFDAFFKRLLDLPENSAFDRDVLLASQEFLAEKWYAYEVKDSLLGLQLAARKVPRNVQLRKEKKDV